ncbi:hypothetical protein YC2023_052912 [Brassica napus]
MEKEMASILLEVAGKGSLSPFGHYKNIDLICRHQALFCKAYNFSVYLLSEAGISVAHSFPRKSIKLIPVTTLNSIWLSRSVRENFHKTSERLSEDFARCVLHQEYFPRSLLTFLY